MTSEKQKQSMQMNSELKSIRAEQVLPVKTVGIESLKESASVWVSPHRRLFTWYARRPTATTRLAILSSILPPDVTNEELHQLMCIGPREGVSGGIERYIVERYATKDDRDGSIKDHFGYDYPHKRVPVGSELDNLHEKLREHWDGELPTVLDPTAGGGTIPFEALRYGLPTISNELNPVAWLINKVILEHAPKEGSLEQDIRRWMKEVQKHVREELDSYFPKRNGVSPNNYFRAYSIDCPSCGKLIPVSNKWWFNRRRGIAVRPTATEERIEYEVVQVPDEVSKGEFDPDNGTVDRGDIECPHCGVVTERDDTVELFNSGDFNHEVCAVRYINEINGTKYHSPTEEDREAIKRAQEQIDSNLDLATILTEDRYLGHHDRAGPYGVKQWRDAFSPRQLLSHATYLNAFKEIEDDIKSEYSKSKAESILILLSFISVKLIQRNSRLAPIKATRGSPSDMMGSNIFFFQWHFGEGNLMTGTYSYESEGDNIIENYEQVVQYVNHIEDPDVKLRRGDASSMPYEDESIEAVVIDPPYGDNVMYGEVSDAFYVWFKRYLGDVFPEAFSSQTTNKIDEAVENPSLVEASEGQSKTKLASERYEEKMESIFREIHRLLKPGGVLTIYFTDKEVEAWDSLTMSIIQSGFTITATHTITSEMPQRIGVQQSASADSTLLLVCRKPRQDMSNNTATLWNDIKQKTQKVAREKADELLSSDYSLTKTDTIIGAFGPTLRVFTSNYPVVDRKDELVRPRQALQAARSEVTKFLIERELEGSLDEVDPLTTWYLLSWLVYERAAIPYDEARQLGVGVGVEIDEVKRTTKIWKKSGDEVVLASESDRVQDYDALESGVKRRKRKYPVNPQDITFKHNIDTVHAAMNVLKTKGGSYTLKWLDERDMQDRIGFKRTIESLLQVLPDDHEDYQTLVNISSGETGKYVGINTNLLTSMENIQETEGTTLNKFRD